MGSRERHIITGRMFTDGESCEDSLVATEGGRIAYAGPVAGFDPGSLPGADTVAVPDGGAILPGLIDLHCHGAVGGDFPAGDAAASRAAVAFLHRSGTTTLLASLVTASRADLMDGIRMLRILVAEGLLAGIHLEGPFLSHARCGAQNPAWLLEPDLDVAAELLATGRGAVRTMTYAPELPGADALVNLLAEHGVIPSLGHTDSSAEIAATSLVRARAALEAAASAAQTLTAQTLTAQVHTEQVPAAAVTPGGDVLTSRDVPGGVGPRPTVTHLFNGMPPLHHRAPGPVAACLRAAKAGGAAVELIADGVHLDPQTVRMVFELVGPENVVLVTDSMAATGLSDGGYVLGPSAVTVRGGVATLDSTGSIAGGTATLLDVVARTVAAGVPAADAVLAATAVPACVLGLSEHTGSLRPGLAADVVLTGPGFELHRVLRAGRWLAEPKIASAPSAPR